MITLVEALTEIEFRVHKLLKEKLPDKKICQRLDISKTKLKYTTDQINKKISFINHQIANTPAEPFSTNEMDYGGLGEYCKVPVVKKQIQSEYGDLTVGEYELYKILQEAA